MARYGESMKTHQLRSLVAVADAGSVRGAARLLDTSPAAITQNLQSLENDVQMQLVQRTTSGVSLTESGNALLVHARLIITQMNRAYDAVDALRGNFRKRLSVAVTPWVALTFLPEAVTRFRQRMPAIHLEIFEGLLAIANPRLRDGSLDLYIGRRAPGVAIPDLSCRPLFGVSRVAIARCHHPKAESRSLADLLDQDWLVPLDPETERQVPYRMFERHGLPAPHNIHYVHSLSVAIPLLQRTDMIGIFPWPLVELCAGHAGLSPLPLREQFDESVVGIITRAGEPPDAASACFIDCLIESVRDKKWENSAELRRAMHSVDLLI
jgi:LysR family transcriptional regulator, regulator of abg operon